MKNAPILTLLLLALAIRLILAIIPGFKFDVDSWFYWANRLNEMPLWRFYSPEIFTDYTPGYLYILGLLGFIQKALNLAPEAFFYLLKLPAIFAEVFIGFLVYKISSEFVSNKKALLLSSGILFNLALIFNSSIWGQVDSVLTLFMLLSIYYLTKKNLIFSSLFLGIAFMVKPQTIALFPLFAVFLFKNFSKENLLRLILPGTLVVLIVSFPFFPSNPLMGLINRILETAAEYPYTSLNAYNFWGVFGFWGSDATLIFGIPAKVWGYLIYTAYWFIITYFFYKKRLGLFSFAALACLAFFFLPTRVHERYLYPVFPFLLLAGSYLKQKSFFVLFFILSIVHFLNLYYVYIFYQVFHLKLPSVIYSEFVYNLVASWPKSLSLFSVILFIALTFIILRYERLEKTR